MLKLWYILTFVGLVVVLNGHFAKAEDGFEEGEVAESRRSEELHDDLENNLLSRRQVHCCKKCCPRGKRAARNYSFRPRPMGCGPGRLVLDTSGAQGVTECCYQHDICYGTCGARRRSCDDNFRSCLGRACNGKGCYEFLATIVDIVGCPAFGRAQDKACICR